MEDDVYSSDDSEEEEVKEKNESDSQMSESEASEASEVVVKKSSAEFPKSFIFSCIGIGLSNIARKAE